jgi:hypothetical protein
MKRAIAIVVALVALVPLAGCGGSSAAPFTDAQNLTVESNFVLSCTDTASQAGSDPSAAAGVCYVAYKCLSAGGSTAISYEDLMQVDVAVSMGQPVAPKSLANVTACLARAVATPPVTTPAVATTTDPTSDPQTWRTPGATQG